MKDAWTYAHEEAVAAGRSHLSNDHLLLGIARTSGTVARVLADLGVTEAALRRVLDAGESGAARGQDEASSARETPEASRALGRAHGMAIASGEQESDAHLLMALAYDRLGSHAGVLASLGVGSGEIIDGLRRQGLRTPPIEPLPFREPVAVERVVLMTSEARLVIAALNQLLLSGPRERVLNEFGDGRWAYGSVRGRPGYTRIQAEPVVRIREVVRTTLQEAGLPPPADDAWDSALF